MLYSGKASIFLFLFLLLISSGHAAGAMQALVRSKVFFLPEHGTLRPYVEVFYEIDPLTILFDKKDSVFQGRIRADITIANEKGTANEEHYVLETLPVTDGARTLTLKIMDLRRLMVPSGKYTLYVKLTDLIKQGNESVFTDSIDTSVPRDAVFLSDIQLLDTVMAAQGENTFVRNNLMQIPMTADFLERRDNLHFYSELYNRPDTTVNTSIIRRAFISRKPLGDAVYRLQISDTIAPTLVSPYQGRLRVAALSSGNYYLNITATDTAGQLLAGKSQFFQVMNPNPEKVEIKEDTVRGPQQVEIVNLAKSFMAKYTPAQIRAILKMLLPIADPTERNRIGDFLRKADDMYARYFIVNFWTAREPSQPERAWKNYSERVKEVNKIFGSSARPGYETDRGMVQLKYGKPTERVIVNNEAGALPYEVWQYNTIPGQSNAIFLFYRPGIAASEYELLHSTVIGERRTVHWRSALYPNGTTDGISGSRAETFIGNR